MGGFTEIPALVIITYLCAEGFKLIKGGKFKKFIPVFCGALGGVLALIAHFTVPEYIISSNVFEAIATGIVSGFAATGVNQVYKQMTKEDQ